MEYITEPWKHQGKMSEFMDACTIDRYALFWDMGTGKTKQATDWLRLKCYQIGRVPRTLVIGPSAVQENWKREIILHSNIPGKRISVIDGITKADGKQLKNPTKKLKLKQVQDTDKDIYIITMNTVKYLTQTKTCKKTKKRIKVNLEDEVWYWVGKLGIECLIIDESHNFKNNKAKRTKALLDFTHQPQLNFRLILTGSPILQNALDLWSQFYIINPLILGSNFYDMRGKYFYDAAEGVPSEYNVPPNWVPKDEKYFKKLRKTGIPEKEIAKMQMGNINKIIYQHASRVMKRDVLDLPPRVFQTLEVNMSKDQARIYTSMRDELVAFLAAKNTKGGKAAIQKELSKLLEADPDMLENLPEMMSADLAIVKQLRLMQLICGIFTNDLGEVTLLPTERIRILEDTLESILHQDETNKVVLWTIFSPTYDELAKVCEKLGVKYTFLTGKQNKQQKQDNMDAFNNDPEIRVIIANMAAGGTGVNLVGGNYDICYSRGFKLGDWLQSTARTDRGGQTRKTTWIDLVTPKTQDAAVVEKLKEKHEHAEDILAIKEFNKEEIQGML